MKGFMNLLARAKLVELSEEERLVAERSAAAAAADAAPAGGPASPAAPPEPPPPPTLPQEAGEIESERSFDTIFASAGVAPTPFPAEKLLRLLDGLRAMDATTRKAAVLAMDSADDNWNVADCIVDAQRKIAALDAYKHQLAAQVQGSEQRTGQQIAEIRSALEGVTQSIRTQIAELEQLLEREVTKAAQATTGLEAALRATREAAAREARRMDGEIERLREIPAQFAAPGGA